MSYTMDFEDRANKRPDDSIIEYEGFEIGMIHNLFLITDIYNSQGSTNLVLYSGKGWLKYLTCFSYIPYRFIGQRANALIFTNCNTATSV